MVDDWMLLQFLNRKARSQDTSRVAVFGSQNQVLHRPLTDESPNDYFFFLNREGPTGHFTACSVGWFISLLVRKEVLLAGLCERKILFWLKIYDRLRQATAKRTG